MFKTVLLLLTCVHGSYIAGTKKLSSTRFSQISLLQNGGCGLTEKDGYLRCWGQVRDESNGHLEVAKLSGTAFSQISLQAQYGCGVKKKDGHLRCWALYPYALFACYMLPSFMRMTWCRSAQRLLQVAW